MSNHIGTKTGNRVSRMTLRLGLIVATALLLISPGNSAAGAQGQEPADFTSSEVASAWFDLLYDVIKSERAAPPLASRIYGISSVALYEAVVPGTLHHQSLAGQLNGLNLMHHPPRTQMYHLSTVVNTAMAHTIRGLFPSLKPENQEAINLLEQEFATQFQREVNHPVYQRSITQGQVVASAILDWAATDGFSVHNGCPYVPVQKEGAWEPTPPSFNTNPLQPCWGMIRPMALTSGEECTPPGHPAFSTDAASDFYAFGLEVYQVGVNLTDEHKTIADYWSDSPGDTGTPPGHWVAIVGQIVRNDDLSLVDAAEAYARVGIAVHDAFIGCWNAKYVYNLQRPVTYINENIAGDWLPHIVTPPFPSYPSGHSTQSGAVARVLTDMFGNKSFTDTTHTDHGLVLPLEPRTFGSFYEAADEAAVSRLFGGIHYSFSNNDGLVSGKCIGQAILDRVHFNDHANEKGNKKP